MVVISKKYNWRTGVSIPVPLECESSALPFELDPLKMVEIYINYSRHHHCFYLELGYLVLRPHFSSEMHMSGWPSGLMRQTHEWNSS